MEKVKIFVSKQEELPKWLTTLPFVELESEKMGDQDARVLVFNECRLDENRIFVREELFVYEIDKPKFKINIDRSIVLKCIGSTGKEFKNKRLCEKCNTLNGNIVPLKRGEEETRFKKYKCSLCKNEWVYKEH